jgi:predicted nucleotidyltransferase
MENKHIRADTLAEAKNIAENFAERFKRKGVVGIVFLGAIARGYFNKFSDIDIIIFRRKGEKIKPIEEEIIYKGFLIDYAVSTYEEQLEEDWSMEARWAFSRAKIFYDPKEKIKDLLNKKVPLKADEKRWLMIEGMTQSEWYSNTDSKSWIYRSDILSAHYSINNALDELLKALFVLNNELIPSEKWKIYFSQNLKWVPKKFSESLKEIILVKDFSVEELRRRKKALNYLWRQILPKAEKEIGMKFNEIAKLV